MTKIYDCFMFFQELDLLKIRLEYLFPYVDKFIIVESSQTHAGNKKKFIFEKNIKSFEKYLKKIIYYKLDEFHLDIKSVRKKLISDQSEESTKVLNAINQVYANNKYLDEKSLKWLIDIYQRETLFIPLINSKPSENDLIMISDLDEIPNFELVSNLRSQLIANSYTIIHNEFNYFVNLNSRNDWLGTIISTWKILKHQSLNLLRVDAKNNKIELYDSSLPSYHFTSCGDLELIRNKVINFGHQEFNNKTILNNLENNIIDGRDIFGRRVNQKFNVVDISNSNFFDKRMQTILQSYKNLINTTKNKSNFLKYFLFYINLKLLKVYNYLISKIK